MGRGEGGRAPPAVPSHLHLTTAGVNSVQHTHQRPLLGLPLPDLQVVEPAVRVVLQVEMLEG